MIFFLPIELFEMSLSLEINAFNYKIFESKKNIARMSLVGNSSLNPYSYSVLIPQRMLDDVYNTSVFPYAQRIFNFPINKEKSIECDTHFKKLFPK